MIGEDFDRLVDWLSQSYARLTIGFLGAALCWAVLTAIVYFLTGGTIENTNSFFYRLLDASYGIFFFTITFTLTLALVKRFRESIRSLRSDSNV